jgi:hypothetical protein
MARIRVTFDFVVETDEDVESLDEILLVQEALKKWNSINSTINYNKSTQIHSMDLDIREAE